MVEDIMNAMQRRRHITRESGRRHMARCYHLSAHVVDAAIVLSR